MQCTNQIMLCALATLMWLSAASATTITEYSIEPSSELGSYHYPPPIGNQFDEVPQQYAFDFQSVQPVETLESVPQQVPTVSQQVPIVSQQLLTVQQEVPRSSYVQHSGSYQPVFAQPQRHYSTNPFLPVPYPPEYAFFHRRQQQLQQQQQHHQQQPRQQQQQQQPSHQQQPHQQPPHQQPSHQQQQPQQQQLQPSVVPSSEVLSPEQQFHAPALEQNAFTLALTHQGYKFGTSARATNLGEPRSSSTATALQSLNVKLPLPLGITPLNNAPLPLQSGTSFDSLHQGVTSYGTKHPLKV